MARAKTPEATIEKALRKAQGNISFAARLLGLDRTQVYSRIKASKGLLQVVQEARETLLDDAESALHVAISKREGWAVCFALKTIGRVRGYSERWEFEELLKNFESLKDEFQKFVQRGGANTDQNFPRKQLGRSS